MEHLEWKSQQKPRAVLSPFPSWDAPTHLCISKHMLDKGVLSSQVLLCSLPAIRNTCHLSFLIFNSKFYPNTLVEIILFVQFGPVFNFHVISYCWGEKQESASKNTMLGIHFIGAQDLGNIDIKKVSIKGQIVNILEFVGQMISVTNAQLLVQHQSSDTPYLSIYLSVYRYRYLDIQIPVCQ